MVKNSIIWGNATGITTESSTALQITFSDLQGGLADIIGGGTITYQDNLNSDGTLGAERGNGDQAGAEPRFVNATVGDYRLGDYTVVRGYSPEILRHPGISRPDVCIGVQSYEVREPAIRSFSLRRDPLLLG